MNTPRAIVSGTAAVLFALACALPACAQSGALLIVPGVRIGNTRVGPEGSRSLARLPKPDAEDAGMMKEDMAWVSKKAGQPQQTLFIHAVQNGATGAHPINGVTITEIRVTSPQYRTANGIHVGSTYAAILRAYPAARVMASDPVGVDDPLGIAFEFATPPAGASRCIAIHVSAKGTTGFTDAKQVTELLSEGKH